MGIVISGLDVGEDDLRQFIADTERLTGATISLVPQWVVTSSHPGVQQALELLFAQPAPTPGTVVQATVTRKKKTDETPAPYPTPIQEWKVWEVYEDGAQVETVTLSERNRRLNLGLFGPGALLRHPRAGWNEVTGAPGSGQGMTPLSDAEALKRLVKP